MSRVSELIDLIAQGKNTEASEVLNSELMSRAVQGVNDLKPEVAAQYFSPLRVRSKAKLTTLGLFQ